MGLFNFLSKKPKNESQTTSNESVTPSTIPDKLFTEAPGLNGSSGGMEQVYTFLQADYESKGYSDALVNPDNSYKEDNIKLMRLDLQILIDNTHTYYENLISELNLHIVIRSRAGLVDLVQELEARKQLVEDHRKKLDTLRAGMDDENGLCQRIILSYQRGFMKGLTALTQSGILNRKI